MDRERIYDAYVRIKKYVKGKYYIRRQIERRNMKRKLKRKYEK